jgi:hypothetical protein
VTVDAELAALQARVAALEAQQVGGDTITPTYLTIDAQGHVSASFTGIVNALGVTIPEGLNPNPSGQNEIAWVNSGGAVEERIGSVNNGGVAALLAQATPAAAGVEGLVKLEAFNHAATENAILSAAADDTTSSVSASATTHGVVVIDSAGESSFLQLASPNNFRLAAGQGVAAWTGAGAVSVVETALTGLPGAATAIIFGCQTSAHGFASYGGISGNAAGSFTFYAVATGGIPPAGDSAAVTWMAVG